MPAQPTLNFDLPCIGCGYNLRTLSTNSRCPECGTAVNLSLTPRPFAHVQRPVIRRVVLGLVLALLSTLLGAIACLGSPYHYLTAPLALFPGGDKGWLLVVIAIDQSSFHSWQAILIQLSFAIHVISAILLTTPKLRLSRASSLRMGYRITVMLSMLLVAGIWCFHSSELVFLSLVFAFLIDLAQMMLFAGYLSTVAIAATFHDIDAWLGRAVNLLLVLVLISWLGFTFTSSAQLVAVMLVGFYAVAVFFIIGGVVHLALRLYKVHRQTGQ